MFSVTRVIEMHRLSMHNEMSVISGNSEVPVGVSVCEIGAHKNLYFH